MVPWEAGGPALRLNQVLKGIARRQVKPKRKRAAVTIALLLHWRSLFNLSDPAQAMLWAAPLTGFAGLLRKSEFTVPDRLAFDPDRHLTRADVVFHPLTDRWRW